MELTYFVEWTRIHFRVVRFDNKREDLSYQEERKMHVYDTVKKEELELDTKGLIDIMVAGRQVDLILKEKQTDDMGYLTWDVEHWSTVNGNRFIRCYSFEGRVLSESTGHNIYDLANDFKPEEAAKVQLS